MPRYTEDDLQLAIAAVENGMSKTLAAKTYKVPRSTLYDRIKGSIPRADRDSDQQLLSIDQEGALEQWIHVQYLLGAAPSHQQLRLAATKILEAAGIHHTLSKRWTSKFLRRHPSLKTLQGKRIDIARVQGVEPSN